MYARIMITLLFCTMVLPQSFANCFANEGASLSAQAQAIQAINQQFSTPARGIFPYAMLTKDESALLATRLNLLEQLIREHPEEVRTVLLTAEQRLALAANPSTAGLIEQINDVTGEIIKVTADDFEHNTAAYHYRLHTMSRGDLDMYPTSNLNLESMIRQKVVASGVSTRSVMAVDTVARALDVSITVSGPDSMAAAAASPLTCSTSGAQKTAVLLLNFANSNTSFPTGLDKAGFWQQVLTGSVTPSVDTYWKEVSYGRTSVSADVYGPFTLPHPYSCSDTTAMQNDAITMASATVDFSQYTRIALIFPESTCAFGGLGYVGCGGATTQINHPFSVVWIPIMPTYNTLTPLWGDLAHELGHNLGLGHANTLDFGTITLGPLDYQATNPGTVGDSGAKSAAGAITAVNTEYADQFSVMGNAWNSPGPYSAEHRVQILGWIPPSDTQTILGAGSYSVAPAENNSGLRALRVLRDAGTSSWLWLEYHQPSTAYESSNLTAIKGNNMSSGAMIHYEDGTNPGVTTLLLDMTPTKTGNNFLDGALLPGKTWSDPYSLLSLTVNSVAGSGMSVSTKYDPACATLTAAQTILPAGGGTGTVTVTAPSSCSWTAFSNANWIKFSGSTTGSGNGTVTFSADPNTTQDQRGTYITIQRQSLRLVQQGTTITVLPDATLNPGGLAAGGTKTFSISVIDPMGASDLTSVSYLLSGAGQSCQIYAPITGGSVYFYLLQDDGTYSTPVLAGSTASVSNSTCTLSAKDSGLKVSGTTFTLSMSLTLSPGASGAYAVRAAAAGAAHPTVAIPLGTLIVGAYSSLSVSPSTGKPGDSVQATFTGVGTHFDATSVITADNSDIMIGSLSVVNATTINATVKIAANAVSGQRSLTVKTGAENVSTPFTITNGVLTITVGSNSNQLLMGSGVSITATITTSGVTPTDKVTFFDGSPNTVLGTASITNGMATLNLTSLSVGVHQIGASYPGDAQLASAVTSNPVSVSVFDFTMPDSTSLTLAAGAKTNNTVTLSVVPGGGGFPYSINFVCSGAPAGAICSVSPATITPGTSNGSVVVTIATTARARVDEQPLRGFGLAVPVLCGLVLLPGIQYFRRQLCVSLFAVLLVVAGTVALQGCSGSDKSGGSSGSTGSTGSGITGTQAGTTTLTLSGTAVSNSVSLVRTTKLQLSVQ